MSSAISLKIVVTGAAGFIGSAFIRLALKAGHKVVVYDSLTYAGHKENFEEILSPGICDFEKGDICDFEFANHIYNKYQPDAFLNFAAESHVDNSISGPKAFVETNITGTFNLLEATRKYFSTLDANKKKSFRYLQVSTDEVYGSLGETGKFNETLAYQPNSPYSASKAAADHLVRAWHHTYGIPTLTTNCSNNYGPRQYPEKLIPLMIQNALQEKALPVYGSGSNIRDWIHVEDHSRGILLALAHGKPGSTYCFGGNSERTNIQVVQKICAYLDDVRPLKNRKYETLIKFVQDRPGHDLRYAIDDSLAQKELCFKRQYSQFEDGLMATIDWYLQNTDWSQKVLAKMKGL